MLTHRLRPKNASRMRQSSSCAARHDCASAHFTISKAGHMVTGHSPGGARQGW